MRSNIADEAKKLHYGQYIDGNAGFCGDRTPSTSSNSCNGSGGTGMITADYAAYIRLHNTRNQAVAVQAYTCRTVKMSIRPPDSSTGNKALHSANRISNSADEAMP